MMKLEICYDSIVANPLENECLFEFTDTQGILGGYTCNDLEDTLLMLAGINEDWYYAREDYGYAELMTRIRKEYFILPIYKYEHSGVAYSTSPFSCRWDSGHIGYIYVSKDTIKREYNVKNLTQTIISNVNQLMINTIDVFSSWANGECYYYNLTDSNGDLDACGGFIGSDHTKNGILEYVPEVFHLQLELEYGICKLYEQKERNYSEKDYEEDCIF